MRQKARVPVSSDADYGPVAALGEVGAGRRDQQREVREDGRRYTCGLKDQDVLERIGQVVLPAYDVADFQVRIVSAGGQMIGGRSITAQQCEVLNIRRQLGLFTVY